MNHKQTAKSKSPHKRKSQKFASTKKRRHYKRHSKPIILIYGKKAYKCYQYRAGYYAYRTSKGKRRQLVLLSFTSKKLRS